MADCQLPLSLPYICLSVFGVSPHSLSRNLMWTHREVRRRLISRMCGSTIKMLSRFSVCTRRGRAGIFCWLTIICTAKCLHLCARNATHPLSLFDVLWVSWLLLRHLVRSWLIKALWNGAAVRCSLSSAGLRSEQCATSCRSEACWENESPLQVKRDYCAAGDW